MPKVYLDMCSIQRPLDTMRQTRIQLEAEAILGVIALCEAGKVQLVSSDALHLAVAEAAQADYFCTCDDRLLRKAKQIADLKVKTLSPLELIEELERW